MFAGCPSLPSGGGDAQESPPVPAFFLLVVCKLEQAGGYMSELSRDTRAEVVRFTCSYHLTLDLLYCIYLFSR